MKIYDMLREHDIFLNFPEFSNMDRGKRILLSIKKGLELLHNFKPEISSQ